MTWLSKQWDPHRGVEQLVARRAHNPKVAGSSPAPATSSPMYDSASGFSLVFLKALGLFLWFGFLAPKQSLVSLLFCAFEVPFTFAS